MPEYVPFSTAAILATLLLIFAVIAWYLYSRPCESKAASVAVEQSVSDGYAADNAFSLEGLNVMVVDTYADTTKVAQEPQTDPATGDPVLDAAGEPVMRDIVDPATGQPVTYTERAYVPRYYVPGSLGAAPREVSAAEANAAALPWLKTKAAEGKETGLARVVASNTHVSQVGLAEINDVIARGGMFE